MRPHDRHARPACCRHGTPLEHDCAPCHEHDEAEEFLTWTYTAFLDDAVNHRLRDYPAPAGPMPAPLRALLDGTRNTPPGGGAGEGPGD